MTKVITKQSKTSLPFTQRYSVEQVPEPSLTDREKIYIIKDNARRVGGKI